MAVDRVEALLRRVGEALDGAGIPYGVAGGNAVAAWVATVDEGAVRATKDVDVLVRRADLAGVAAALQPVGLIPVDVLGVTIFVDQQRPNPRTGVHIIPAKELIRAHYAHPAPDVTEVVRAAGGFAVIDLAALVTMKLQAFRDIDRVHIRDLLSVNLIDAGLIGKLPADLRGRLKEIQDARE
ncbi:MAG TPA: hypothetical protein VM243_11295 [Phycisphaerae bacterium]|nr:hypothetical protein [Phycisphaerae bacterium]